VTVTDYRRVSVSLVTAASTKATGVSYSETPALEESGASRTKSRKNLAQMPKSVLSQTILRLS
jgi:hypothetical protein